jgi:anti-sigma regulatory factor (Ser/Thr protein kinase)
MRLLASVGSEVREWPGTPIGIACPGTTRRRTLAQAPEGEHLILAEHQALVLADLARRPTPSVVRLDLTPTARLVRTARDMVTRSLLDWGCPQQIGAATLVASELVNNAILHARTDLTVSIARWGDLVRLAVHDATPSRPVRRAQEPTQVNGRGMLLVSAVSQSWGVLPTNGGGKVVWAVLHAPPEAHPDHGRLRLVDNRPAHRPPPAARPRR